MATTRDFTSNYTGKEAIGIVAPAVLAANTLSQELITVHENIEYKKNIQTFASTGFMKDSDCAFESTGTVSLSDVIITPKEMKVNLEFCRTDFIDTWQAKQLKGQLTGQGMPQEFETFLVDRLNALVAKDIETNIWQGTNVVDSFQGLEGLLAANAEVNDVAAADVITVANVLAKLASLVDTIPSRVYSNKDSLRIIVPIKTAKLFQRALGYGQLATSTFINSYNNQLVVGNKPLDFEGIPIFVANGMSDDKMVAGLKEHFHFGTNVLTDMNSVQIIDRNKTEGDQMFRYIMRFSAVTQITNPGDITYYSV